MPSSHRLIAVRFFLSQCVATLLVAVSLAAEEAPGPLTLWYRQPAKAWVEALPIGNGRLGGMVFGGVADEHVQLNDDTLWAGGPKDRCNPEGPRRPCPKSADCSLKARTTRPPLWPAAR